jgi:hypothetical protein
LKTPSKDVLRTYSASTTAVISTMAGMNAHQAPSVSASLFLASFKILPSEMESYGPSPSKLMLASAKMPLAVWMMNTMKM